ncbi:DUF3846 domain-containing protein [Pygmaiobacter massiliensis]|uniref:DUF3846 domain-containing protein n=1 Tax=Pygmaiobacter massiliensis TaxID=1917873 RepID=UPI0028A1E9AE|nr:DUF3846 domain-containing protein [Pygmaiobacter massiliensis]
MNISIYQISSERDENRVCFMGLGSLAHFQGSEQIDSSIYNKVYEGEVACANLEDVYQMFNLDHPADYRGRSLSVSDVVEVNGAAGIESGFYFCDSIGFQKVDFEPEKAQQLNQDIIRVVLLEPGKLAQVAEIDASLAGMQKIVGGCVEGFYPFAEKVCIVCNDEGKINGMPLNRAVYGENKEMLDIIAGTAFICDCRGEDFASLSEEQLKRYAAQFKYPERFYRINDEIKAVPYTPRQKDKGDAR